MEKVGMNYEKDAYFYNNNVVYYSISREAYQSNFKTLKSLNKNENSSKLLRVY
jgi:ribosomal-protein-alanine N-acetyltransferase